MTSAWRRVAQPPRVPCPAATQKGAEEASRLLARWGLVVGGGLGGVGVPDNPLCIEPSLGPGHLLAELVGAKDPALAAEVLSALRFVLGPALCARLVERISRGEAAHTFSLANCTPAMCLRFDPNIRGPLSHKDAEHVCCVHTAVRTQYHHRAGVITV